MVEKQAPSLIFPFFFSILLLDAEEFAKKLNQNHRARKQNITAWCLEQTKSVRAENIPPNTPSHYITVYFENEKYGGAQIVDVQQLPDEDAAIITFGDYKGNAEMQSPYFFFFFENISFKDQNVDFLEKRLLCPCKTADVVLWSHANWSASFSFGPARHKA